MLYVCEEYDVNMLLKFISKYSSSSSFSDHKDHSSVANSCTLFKTVKELKENRLNF